MKGRPGFIMLPHDILDTTAWQYISRSGAAWLLLDIWRRHNGHNNGRIAYSQREAERRFGCSPKRAVRWFRELQEAGFLIAEQRGAFGRKTGAIAARATIWRLTMERCEGMEPTRDYLNFPVVGGCGD
jgi:hypothetical protein